MTSPNTDARKQCIYCLKSKEVKDFSKEHVLHKSLTKRFQKNLVLRHLVCEVCNQYFGDTIDKTFGRSGLQGLLRFDYQMKPLELLHELDSRDTVTAAQHQNPFYDGALAKHIVQDGQRDLDFEPHIAIKKRDGSYVRLTKEQLGQLEQLLEDPEVTSDFGVIGETTELIEAFNQKVRDLGRSWEFVKFAEYVEELPVFSNYQVDDDQARAIAKIAFNYLAKTMENTAPELIFAHWLNSIRAFIRYGNDDDRLIKVALVQAAAIPFVGTNRLRECHLIGIDTLADGVDHFILTSVVNLFQRLVFIVFLSCDYPAPRTISGAHCWNLDTHRVEKLEDPQLTDFMEYSLKKALQD